MKSISKCILIITCLTLLSSVQLFGQEWSEEQKEAWKFIETHWDNLVKEDIEVILADYHDDFIGWEITSPLTFNKAFLRKNMPLWIESSDWVVYNIQPIAINIFDDVAIVHYYHSSVFKDTKGNETNYSGRWTDIIMKQGDRWVLIGDSGGLTE
jgi:ketosteroid isomerase-like protein